LIFLLSAAISNSWLNSLNGSVARLPNALISVFLSPERKILPSSLPGFCCLEKAEGYSIQKLKRVLQSDEYSGF
jgi:hypothetical protein